MFLLNGKALAIDTPFEYEGVRYPANWLLTTGSTGSLTMVMGRTQVRLRT